MGRQIRKIISKLTKLSDTHIKNDLITRFSEDVEVLHYKEPFGIRGEVLARKFITKKNSKILDVGCASGGISFSLANQGHNLTGIDISPNMIKGANQTRIEKKISNVQFKCRDIVDFNEKNKYDYAIALFNIFTFIPNESDRLKAITNIIASLKKGGVLFFDSSNKFGSIRIFFKQLAFKLLFLLCLKNRPFGDVYSNPCYSGSKEVVFQHLLSKAEVEGYLKKIKGIEYKIEDYSLFLDKESTKEFFTTIKKL